MLRNLFDKLKVSQVLKPQAISADTDTIGFNVADFGSLAFLVDVATFAFDGTNKIELKLLESDDNVTFTVAGSDAKYEDNIVLDSNTKDDMVHVVEYRGAKKYAALRLDVSGTVSCIIGVAALGGHAEFQPPL
jgi:hypothetical protein